MPAIRGFIDALKQHLEHFTPAELYLLFQQNGMLQAQGKGRAFIDSLATGRFPFDEIEKFCLGESSLVDSFVANPQFTLESLDEQKHADGEEVLGVANESDVAELTLPIIETKDALASLQAAVAVSADQEAIEFLIASALSKIWRHCFHDEAAAVTQAEAFAGDSYSTNVRELFIDELRHAKHLDIPAGYSFSIDDKVRPPNLMQRLTAIRVRDRKRIGNWSGTGAGKTLSAVLASRVIGAKLTVICCPNSVVEGWREAILNAFPESVVATKTFTPDWSRLAGDETGFKAIDNAKHRYLVLNYEAFQQPDSESKVAVFCERERIDFVVVDEIHFTKQRTVENLSKRKKLVSALIASANERNPLLCVIGMSATPVINNLQEGKSLVEMVSGLAHTDFNTTPTMPNCMRLHQRLVSIGTRWLPEYDVVCDEQKPEVDCSDFVDEIRALGKAGTPLQLEQILTRARLPVIRQHVCRKTLIYTHYIQGIDRIIRDALVSDGWKVGFYTGEDHSGLDDFINGDLDVLIGSSASGTGVDGLQQVCSKLIINVLPWTNAEFEQLKGRIYRQGQSAEKVTVVIPITFALVNGERWSWCESKMHRLKFKKSIADAAVDGVVPEGHLRSPAQAYQDVIGWLRRLDAGEVEVIARPRIVMPLSQSDPAEVTRRARSYGDFSTMNHSWNTQHSSKTYERLQNNPEEWAQYHTLYREARQQWAAVPYEEMIRWCKQRSDYVIGDFGCGEAKLAEALAGSHTVYSFDYFAINEDVVACDMAHVPLEDELLDIAIFSLSLMGSNFSDYLHEAYRVLKIDGQLHIIEATSRFSEENRLVEALEALGFTIVKVQSIWKFTHTHALKTNRETLQTATLKF